MRRRLLLSTCGAAAVAVILLGLPLAVAVRSLLETQALDAQQGQVEAVQALLNQQVTTLDEAAFVLAVTAEQTRARLTLLDRAGRIVIDTGGAPVGARAVSPDLDPALAGGVGRLVGEGSVAVSVPVAVRGSPLILRSARDDADLRADIRRAWLAIGALAATALLAAATAALWQGRRLARPLEQLATSARRLGEGDFSARAPRSGLPEPDEVAEALDRTAERLGLLLERTRDLGADASHQLRTPLTALRLHLEALAAAGSEGDRRAALEAAEDEADRLERTIDELMALTRPQSPTVPVDVAAIVRERLPAWEALAAARGRRVVLDAQPVQRIAVRPQAVGQCLQVLLDNALEHGRGTVTVRVGPTGSAEGGPAGRHEGGSAGSAEGGPAGSAEAGPGGVRLCVADEGPGPPPGVVRTLHRSRDHGGRRAPAAPRPSGNASRGLVLARALAEAEGGRLRVETDGSGSAVCLFLPAAGTASARAVERSGGEATRRA